jgi:hypothetical protein
MDSGNDRMQNGAHRIGWGIEIYDEVLDDSTGAETHNETH